VVTRLTYQGRKLSYWLQVANDADFRSSSSSQHERARESKFL